MCFLKSRNINWNITITYKWFVRNDLYVVIYEFVSCYHCQKCLSVSWNKFMLNKKELTKQSNHKSCRINQSRHFIPTDRD